MRGERQPDDVAAGAARCVEALDAIHELAHEEQPAAVLALEVLRVGGVDGARVEVEAAALVRDFDDEPRRVSTSARTWTCLAGSSSLPRRIAFESASVSATGTLSMTGARCTRARHSRCARARRRARCSATSLGISTSSDDAKRRGVGSRQDAASWRWSRMGARRGAARSRRRATVRGPPDGGPTPAVQKLCSARSRVSAIWKSVSSLVSSNSVLRSSLRFASRSSPPCSRIFFDSETSTPRPELSM